MKKKFTFGVLAYNQENEILSTLNSIKYQIANYGKNIFCNLIITDDCSSDKTVDVCKKWIDDNRGIFENVIMKENKENCGTVENYNYILSKINEENFKIIAGDDLISSNNIFKICDCVGKHTLFCGLKLMFRNNNLILEKDDIYRQFYLSKKKLTRKKNLTLFKLGFVISTPQTLYQMALYNDSNAIEFNSKFTLFEDNPTWYCMLKNVKDINIQYARYPIVIYRLSENSVSNSITKVNTIFQEELNKLYDIYMNEGTFFDKLYVGSLKKGRKSIFNLSKYLKKAFHVKCRLYSLLHKKEYQIYCFKLKQFLKKELEYLNKLI